MEAAPAFEAMFLHAILHRVEGDYANAKAWYTSVAEGQGEADLEAGTDDEPVAKSEADAKVKPSSKANPEPGVFEAVWKSSSRGFEYLASVEDYVRFGRGDRDELERQGRAELERTIAYLRGKFGDESWQNAASEWRFAEGETKVIKEKMILGDRGYRVF